MNRRSSYFAGLLLAVMPTAALNATTLSYSGTLTDPNALFDLQFTLSGRTGIIIETTSWKTGSFDPVLWLFDSAGNQIGKNDDITSRVDMDARLTDSRLEAGAYHLVLSTFDQHFCLANTTCGGVFYESTGWSYNGSFDDRSHGFAFTISDGGANSIGGVATRLVTDPVRATPESATPEPASAGLVLAGGAFLVWGACVRRRHGNCCK